MATSSNYDVEKHIILDVFPKTCLFNLLGFFLKSWGPFYCLGCPIGPLPASNNTAFIKGGFGLIS